MVVAPPIVGVASCGRNSLSPLPRYERESSDSSRHQRDVVHRDITHRTREREKSDDVMSPNSYIALRPTALLCIKAIHGTCSYILGATVTVNLSNLVHCASLHK